MEWIDLSLITSQALAEFTGLAKVSVMLLTAKNIESLRALLAAAHHEVR